MKEILPRSSTDRSAGQEELPAPQGIGMAVAFDWGLAVQVLLTPVLTTFFGFPSSYKLPGVSESLGTILSFVISWPIALGIAMFGEAIRRGRNWARLIQVGANALLTLAGIGSLVSVYKGIKTGNFWPTYTALLLLVVSPLITWRLSRPATRRWFKNVNVAEARRRHGGSWGWFIAIWAIVGGVLQTIAALK